VLVGAEECGTNRAALQETWRWYDEFGMILRG